MSSRAVGWPAVLLTLTACALLALLPGFLGHTRLNDSFWIDWVWLDQFARELRAGVIYPRWLPLSHDGLGSPVFYYYPPLSFYLGSVVIFAGLSTYTAILVSFLVASVLSGIGMYLWLKGQSRWALAGAALFVIAPYHTADFYIRGAVAEYTGIAVLPFVMWGLRRLYEDRRNGIPITGISYAALIGSHLPLALLASVFLIGPYAAWKGYQRPQLLPRAAVALTIGLALAAIYLVPALSLNAYRDAAALWLDSFQPRNWSMWNPRFRTTGGFLAVLAMGAGLAIPLILLPRKRSPWVVCAVGCIALGIGVLPFVWTLPGLKSVQFPYRILPVAEFAVATAIARADWSGRTLFLACLPVVIVTLYVIISKPPPDAITIAQLQRHHPDVPENLPPGSRPYSWPSLWALNVAHDSPRPRFAGGVTTEPVFYFPAWYVECGGNRVATFPDARTQLLSYRGRGCSRRLGLMWAERLGGMISLAGLIALCLAGVRFPWSVGRRRS